MKQFELLKDAPFEALDIPAPEKLETTEDFAALTQHLISVYRPALNLYHRQHGLEERTELLTMLVLVLTGIMPEQHPEYIRNYPGSLNEIYALAGGLLVAGADRKAG